MDAISETLGERRNFPLRTADATTLALTGGGYNSAAGHGGSYSFLLRMRKLKMLALIGRS